MNKQEKDSSENNIDRRTFLMRMSLTFAAVSAAVAAIPVISAVLAPLLEEVPEQWRSVGNVQDFELGSTQLVTFQNADPKPYAGATANSAAWVRRNQQNEFIVFAANCTHLGCPVRWEEHAHLFMCPCHGGVYYEDGTVAAGPPPKPLNHYQVRIRNNEVQIQTAPIPITGMTA